MTPIDLDAIEARASVAGRETWLGSSQVDHSQADVPALIAEVRRLRAEVAPTTTEWGVARIDPWDNGRPQFTACESETAARLVVDDYGRATVYLVSREVTAWTEATP
ncbi:MAG: hypothetical protein ACOH10_11275 [Rhodoglobus sp.]